ncbi:MAG TPA: hypothetical protein VMW52_05655 [Phycisphaerae bacterium]|nr:hypothetical protein [Phycisphaerae bacterium]
MSWLKRLLTAHDVSVDSETNAVRVATEAGMTALGVDEITVDDTATGKTLAALLTAAGAAIHASVRRITLIPNWWGEIPYWSFDDDAVAGVNPMLWGGEIECRPAEAALIKLVTETGTAAVTVVQEG